MLVVDVKEPKETAGPWAKKMGFTFPVLLDEGGKTAASYAPEGVLPDLPRDQVPIASNLIIDKEGTIRFFTLLDSRNFDAKLVALTTELDKVLGGGCATNVSKHGIIHARKGCWVFESDDGMAYEPLPSEQVTEKEIHRDGLACTLHGNDILQMVTPCKLRPVRVCRIVVDGKKE